MQVAQTISEQIGGGRFQRMTGARDFVGGENFLMFRLPRGSAKNGINKVRITLDPCDTYTVEFFKVSGVNVTLIHSVDDVYCDMLEDVFTMHTGLYTRF